MRTPEDAIHEILSHARPPREHDSVSLDGAEGRVLAQDVVSDVDLPPFRKSAMDGYALRFADIEGGRAVLDRIGESRAGHPFEGNVGPGSCISIFTGAEVPAGYDTVVMVERSEREGEKVTLEDRAKLGQNICNRGEDLAEGEVVKRVGRRLTATDLSVLAAVGCDPVPVFRKPRVTILTTGDELVRPDQKPGPGQIREGNTLHLAALARRAGAEVDCQGLVPDEADVLRERFARALECSDAVITTGGVSVGEYDLVADAFQACGVEQVFHKIAIKPGKPLWFGKRGDVLVFGLPGNPVSCLLDHEVFVRPALARLEGASSEPDERLRLGRWGGSSPRLNARQQYLQVVIAQGAVGVEVLSPPGWSSSADIVGLSRAAGMAVVPPNETFETGALVRYRPFYG